MTKRWYYARIRWAVLEEGEGLREWQEAAICFKAGNDVEAFERALQLGREDEQSHQEGRVWVAKRLAKIVELDVLSDRRQFEFVSKPADRHIAFEHLFEPEKSEPQAAF
jgi:hypothetical protein